MLGKKPVIAIYDLNTDATEKEKIKIMGTDSYLNVVASTDGKYHSFRCPNQYCGKPVIIGRPKCSFCGTRLKWKYPFETIKLFSE